MESCYLYIQLDKNQGVKMEDSFIFFLIMFLLMGCIPMIQVYYKNQYEKSRSKFSDAEIFKLMSRANHFLTAKQLSMVSALSKKEAANRLAYLSMKGIVKKFQDGSGMRTVYQLKEALPEDDILPISIEGLTETEIVDAVMRYSKDYQITIAELVIIFGIEIELAKQTLERLKKSGLVKRLWKGTSLIYVVKDPLIKGTPKFESSSPPIKIKLPKESKQEREIVKLKIPDADILRLAIEHKGRLTVTLVCLKLNISIEEAQIKLDDLYEQGAFIIDVNQQDALVEYYLRDKNLLEQ